MCCDLAVVVCWELQTSGYTSVPPVPFFFAENVAVNGLLMRIVPTSKVPIKNYMVSHTHFLNTQGHGMVSVVRWLVSVAVSGTI